jgi:TolB-like protein/Tfp pilus assembly protein PilF
MFTDIVGYTALTQANEAGTLLLLQEQEGLLRPLFAGHRGREIKSTGDGYLVEFDSALRAVECAIEIQKRLRERNARPGTEPLRLRIGVHLGDVEVRGSDIFGDSVNIAARVEPLADPGGICITEPVFGQVRNKLPDQFEKLGPTALRNVSFPIAVYKLAFPSASREPIAASPGTTRLAVLPLANISPDSKDEYFADGLTEELIATLSKVRELRVIARTSVSQYKATSKTVAQIGNELGVTSVLEGSVRREGNRVRITLQLIDARTQEHIWAESFDRELTDVFVIQREVAEKTAKALRIEMLGPERESLRKAPTSSLEAYDLYLKGNYAAHLATNEGVAESIQHLEEAIREDPQFSLAHSALANVYITLAGATLSAREAFSRARELTFKALELDPGSSDAHTARGNLALQQDQDWAVAESEFREAISLNPSNAAAHNWFGFFLLIVRRFAEATEQYKAAIELDPLWGEPRIALRATYTNSRQFGKAIALAEETRDRDPKNPGTHVALGLLYFYSGRIDDARKEAELLAGPLNPADRFARARLWAELGKPEEARLLVRELEDESKTGWVDFSVIAALYAAIGENAKALDWLERDYQEGDRQFWFFYQSMGFDRIREEPRFRTMVERLNLPAM